MTTWNDLITEKLEENGETWEDVEHCTLDSSELHRIVIVWNIVAFNVFTPKYVYFPHNYDDYVASCKYVPRHPYTAEPTVIGE